MKFEIFRRCLLCRCSVSSLKNGISSFKEQDLVNWPLQVPVIIEFQEFAGWKMN